VAKQPRRRRGLPWDGRLPLLELIGLNAGYAKRRVLHDVDLCIRRGEIVASWAPTARVRRRTLRAISGRRSNRAGTLLFWWEIAAGLQRFRHGQTGIAHVPEGRGTMGPVVGAWRTCGSARTCGATVLSALTLSGSLSIFPILKERRHQFAAPLAGRAANVGNPRAR